jgi:hypothetical protein
MPPPGVDCFSSSSASGSPRRRRQNRASHPFHPHDELASSIQRIIGAVEKLRAAESEYPDSETQSCDGEETPSHPGRLRAARCGRQSVLGPVGQAVVRRTGFPQLGGEVLRPLRHDGAWRLGAGRVVHPLPQRGHAALAALPLLADPRAYRRKYNPVS